MNDTVKKEKFTKRHPRLTILLVVLGLLFAISMGSGSSGSSTNTASTTPSSSSSVSIGQNGVLREGSQKDVLLATTKDNLDQLVKSSVAKDTDGITEMVLKQEAFFADAGTKVLVIDSAFGVRRVRITEGDLKGMSGWIPMEFVVKE